MYFLGRVLWGHGKVVRDGELVGSGEVEVEEVVECGEVEVEEVVECGEVLENHTMVAMVTRNTMTTSRTTSMIHTSTMINLTRLPVLDTRYVPVVTISTEKAAYVCQ